MEPSSASRRSNIHSFDIDKYLNPIIPRPRFQHLPTPISHFLGYRPPAEYSAPSISLFSHPSTLYVWIFAFLGAFIGIAIIENVYLVLPPLGSQDVPLIIASFGAAAILEYNTIESPLAQPRNCLLGQFISAAIGVSITKIFRLLPPDRFEELRWIAGALSVGLSSSAMGITKTVHPPAGATALLAATNNEIMQLGWWLLALVLLGSALMLASAMLLNNLYKRFPLYWWTPVDLEQLHKKRVGNREDDILTISEAEKGQVQQGGDSESSIGSSVIEPELHADQFHKRDTHGHVDRQDDCRPSIHSTSDLTVTNSREDSNANPARASVNQDLIRSSRITVSPPPRSQSESRRGRDSVHHHQRRRSSQRSQSPSATIEIHPNSIIIPDWIQLSAWERGVLEVFRGRLTERKVQSRGTC